MSARRKRDDFRPGRSFSASLLRTLTPPFISVAESGRVFRVLFCFFVAVFNFFPGRYHYLGLIRNEKPKRAFAVGLLGYFQILDSSFAAWHEEADAYLVLKVTWITQEYFSRERIMSATFPGFVFLLGILHVCSGKTPTSALQSLADIKRQESNNSAIFI